MIQRSLKTVLLGTCLAFLGCEDKNSLESRSLIRYDRDEGMQVLDEFENMGGGEVEVCVSGPLDRNEERTYYYVSRHHYQDLCKLVGHQFEHAGYISKTNPELTRKLRVVVMDEKMQEIVNRNYSFGN